MRKKILPELLNILCIFYAKQVSRGAWFPKGKLV